jgi:hypothetical protein
MILSRWRTSASFFWTPGARHWPPIRPGSCSKRHLSARLSQAWAGRFRHPYVGRRANGEIILRLAVSFSGDDWIFTKSMIVMADGQKTVVPLSSGDVDTDADGDRVYESIDLVGQGELIREIAAATKEVYVSLAGRHRRKSWKLGETQLIGFRAVVELYDAFREAGQFGIDLAALDAALADGARE